MHQVQFFHLFSSYVHSLGNLIPARQYWFPHFHLWPTLDVMSNCPLNISIWICNTHHKSVCAKLVIFLTERLNWTDWVTFLSVCVAFPIGFNVNSFFQLLFTNNPFDLISFFLFPLFSFLNDIASLQILRFVIHVFLGSSAWPVPLPGPLFPQMSTRLSPFFSFETLLKYLLLNEADPEDPI